MSEQQTSGTGKEGSEAAAVKEALSLRGDLLELAAEEGRLDLQRLELQSQLTSIERQTQDTSQESLASLAQERLGELRLELAGMEERLKRIRAEKEEMTRRQRRLLDKIDVLRNEHQRRAASKPESAAAWTRQPASRWPQRPQRPGGSRPLIISLGMLALVLVVSLALVRAFYGPDITPTPSNDDGASSLLVPTYQPNGKGPTDAECQARSDYTCYSPEDIQQAFGLTPLYQSGFDGHGQTIVILGAGYTNTLQSDLSHFDQTWGLPDPQLTILKPHGPPTPYTCPSGEDDLAIENTLDVQWAHAIAPGANIVLVIGSNGTNAATPALNCGDLSLKDDIAYALNNHLGQIISISQSYSEAGQISDTPDQEAAEQQLFSDAHALFAQAASEQVTVIASAGNYGAATSNDSLNPASFWSQPGVSWPASDPDVLAVGGTSFMLNAAGSYGGETVWNNQPSGATGGGLSAVFSEPDYQQTVPNQLLFQGRRGVPDVAFPARGFLIYGTFQTGKLDKIDPSSWLYWDVQGGTDAGAPAWAGLIALANQIHGKPLGMIQPALYSLQGQDLHDITDGNNNFSSVLGYKAMPGYDLATGWGTPIASGLLFSLIQATDRNVTGCQSATHLCH